jgi:cyanophycinase
LTLLGLKVHVMGEGCRYDLNGRHAFAPDEHAAFCTLPNEKVSTH